MWRMASDQTSFDSEAFCQAVRTWAAEHRGVTMLDLMNAVDTAPDADAVAAFLANPEQHTVNGKIERREELP